MISFSVGVIFGALIRHFAPYLDTLIARIKTKVIK